MFSPNQQPKSLPAQGTHLSSSSRHHQVPLQGLGNPLKGGVLTANLLKLNKAPEKGGKSPKPRGSAGGVKHAQVGLSTALQHSLPSMLLP